MAYRDEIRLYVKTFSADNPSGYVKLTQLMRDFTNRLMKLGIKREDIKHFQTTLPCEVGDKQRQKVFFTITYYFSKEIV